MKNTRKIEAKNWSKHTWRNQKRGEPFKSNGWQEKRLFDACICAISSVLSIPLFLDFKPQLPNYRFFCMLLLFFVLPLWNCYGFFFSDVSRLKHVCSWKTSPFFVYLRWSNSCLQLYVVVVVVVFFLYLKKLQLLLLWHQTFNTKILFFDFNYMVWIAMPVAEKKCLTKPVD